MLFDLKKQVLGVFIGSTICISLFQSSVIFATPKTKNVSIQKEAVFLDVNRYEQKTKKDSLDTLQLKFSIDGKTTTLPVNNGRKNNGIYSFLFTFAKSHFLYRNKTDTYILYMIFGPYSALYYLCLSQLASIG